MKLYKLTDANGCTYSGTQWGPGVTHEAKGGADQPLCTNGWIHFYTHPLLAVLFNPIHANFKNPLLWEAEGEGESKDDCGMKVGYRKGTTIRQVPLPVVTVDQAVRFGILCTADKWLSGEDRKKEAAAAQWALAAARSGGLTALSAALSAAYAAAKARAAAQSRLDLIAIAERAISGEPINSH